MAGLVSLKDVVDAIESLPGQTESVAYLNKKTGELYEVIAFTYIDQSDLELGAEEEAKQEEVTTSEDWLALPSMFDFHEYAVMEDFCESIKDEEVQDRLFTAIRGKGAFRRFKDAAQRAGVIDSWFAYRDERLREFAACWLDVQGIAYEKSS